jgi:hypothetical protein
MRRAGWGFLALAVAVVAALALFGSVEGAGPSTLSRGPDGWLAARHYLEQRGVEVRLLDRRFSPEEVAPVLVTTLPWSRIALGADHAALVSWVEGGGTLVVGYTGRARRQDEESLFEAFGLPTDRARPDPPCGPFAWRRWARETWSLAPAGPLSGAAPLVVRARDRLPSAPPRAEALFRRPETGAAAVFALSRGDGRLLLLPADAFANARLAEAGNADLLETLAGWLGASWSFDEYHHGLTSPEAAADLAPPLAFDLFALHLALLYLLAVAALARRFGPAWREPVARSGSAGSFLVGLGRLHDRLGHHPEAAGRLVARALELEPSLALPADLAARAERARARDLLAIAGEVARARRRRRSGT